MKYKPTVAQYVDQYHNYEGQSNRETPTGRSHYHTRRPPTLGEQFYRAMSRRSISPNWVNQVKSTYTQ